MRIIAGTLTWQVVTTAFAVLLMATAADAALFKYNEITDSNLYEIINGGSNAEPIQLIDVR